jgi:hypothetical protein
MEMIKTECYHNSLETLVKSTARKSISIPIKYFTALHMNKYSRFNKNIACSIEIICFLARTSLFSSDAGLQLDTKMHDEYITKDQDKN